MTHFFKMIDEIWDLQNLLMAQKWADHEILLMAKKLPKI